METKTLVDIFQTRLDEHAMSVRAKVEGEIEIVPHPCTLGMRSADMMKQVRENANIRYLSATTHIQANRKGLKETLVAANQKDTWARNSDGELRK